VSSSARRWTLRGYGKQALPAVTRVPSWPPLAVGEAVEVVAVEDVRAAIDELRLHDDTGDPLDVGYMRALDDLAERLGLNTTGGEG
jgi:hypothetical protein